jgi:uncharacterized RDD family membrane protein YckC
MESWPSHNPAGPPPAGGYWPPPPGYPPPGYPPPPPRWLWKGAALGRPPSGPGSLAEPLRRLGARALDYAIFLPVTLTATIVAVVLAAPHYGPLFPPQDNSSTGTGPVPGFLWLELTVVATSLVLGGLFLLYQAYCTVHWGRTPGKAILHIRPLKTDGRPVGAGAAVGREALYDLSLVVGMIGLIDPLWCLWDGDRQCLHDKVLSTIVVQD